ncbi:hypothetical protein SAMN05444401_1663 [Clostridium amylolyticum]|uniref:Uncharacterized protein n=1 Tax=Clostridium amylolyticum TaxID=1121298 RepID=A0A1M6EQX0_9CLOT|nr:hypothetical protein [Clostridium amylolyticum]SHI87884.1 hypothetical protein SAMN05444401_1663 [Clostridium amylolyticum]
MSLGVLKALGAASFLFAMISVSYFVFNILGNVKLVKAMKEAHKIFGVLALITGFIHGYYLAGTQNISGYFSWLSMAALAFSCLFLRPENGGGKWKAFHTALIVMLILFACFHIYGVLIGYPTFKIMDSVLSA